MHTNGVFSRVHANRPSTVKVTDRIAARAEAGSIATSIRVGPLIAVSVGGAVIRIVAIDAPWRPLTAMPKAHIAATAAERVLIASSLQHPWSLEYARNPYRPVRHPWAPMAHRWSAERGTVPPGRVVVPARIRRDRDGHPDHGW